MAGRGIAEKPVLIFNHVIHMQNPVFRIKDYAQAAQILILVHCHEIYHNHTAANCVVHTGDKSNPATTIHRGTFMEKSTWTAATGDTTGNHHHLPN